MKDHRIAVRITAKEQNRIAALAKQCGLNQTEYIRQRALGYAPKSAPPEPFFRFCEKADALLERVPAPEVRRAALELFRETERLLLALEKEVIKGPTQSCETLWGEERPQNDELSEFTPEAINGA